MSSSNGTTWIPGTAAEQNPWYSVTYGNGLFVAVAIGGASRVMTSPDGANWTPRAVADASRWQSITIGDGQFVAVAIDGANRVMTSSCH
jgi:hypothetical protein